MKRPALYTFLIFAASIAAARYLKGLYLYVFALAVLLFCLILYEKIKSLSVFILSIAAGVGLLAMGNFSYSHTVEKGTEIVKGTVLDISFNSSGGETVILNNLSFCYKEGEKDIDGRAVIYTAEDTFVKRNDIIAVECDIVPAATVKSISGFDEGEYMLANRLVLSANAKNIFMLGHKKDGPRQMLLNFRDSLGTVADNIYPRYESGIVKAIVMGDTADLPKKARELYTSAGAAHILAVSGLHTAVISIMIMRLLKALRIGIRKASIAAILLLFVYAVFAGARPSVVRSVIMVNTVLAGRLLYRKSDALNSLGASGLCILMANPYSLFNTGFQLSFISVAAVLLFYESWENSGEGLLARVKELALLSASVTVFTFPVLALRFYKVQIYGFITNILIVPFLGILTGMGILSIGLGMVNIGMGRFCGGIVYCLLNYFDIVCGFVSRLPFSNIITGRLPLLFVLAFYGMLFSAVKIKTVNRRRALTAVLTALCVISVLSNRLVFKYSTVSFMPKEYGGGAVIETFDKKIYLIGQTSPNDSFNEAERLCGYINSLGRQYADALILAGTESGDFRLASKLIKLSGVKRIYIPEGSIADMGQYETLQFVSSLYGAGIYRIGLSESAYIGENMKISCLYSSEGFENETASGSIIAGISIGERNFVYTGRISPVEMRYVVFSGTDIKADAIYIDSEYSNSKYFIDYLSQAGAENIVSGSGFKTDSALIDTSGSGMVSFKTNGKRLYTVKSID